MLFKRKYLLALFTVIIFIYSDLLYGQCSMCRAVLQSEEGQQTAKGINKGILYLMSIPYILVFFVGWKIIKILKK